MRIEDEVKRLARKLRLPAGEPFPPGASEDQITMFERRVGIKLPGELVEWLRFTNGPCIGPGGIFGIDTPRNLQNIDNYYKSYPSWRVWKWIPVAGDGCGNCYVLVQASGRVPVAFVDTTRGPDELDYVVASDLWHFLRFHFRNELDRQGWPFDEDMVLGEDPALRNDYKIPKPWEVD